MHEEVISKKDLLLNTGISYGQLYRWKRKNLIPEEWFIKKSVSTGQETFFPKEKILDRITTILKLKDDTLLDDLAYKLSNDVNNISIFKNYLIDKTIVSKEVLNDFENFMGAMDIYERKNLFLLFIYEKLISYNSIEKKDINKIILSIKSNYNKLPKSDYHLGIFKKSQVYFYLILKNQEYLLIDDESICICSISLDDIYQKISLYSTL